MRLGSICPCVLAACLLAASSRAGSTIHVRLVQASNEGAGVSAGLEDVVGALRGSLVFHHYVLIGSQSVPMPPPVRAFSVGPYQVNCSGGQGQLQIQISEGKRQLLRTTVSLRDGKPIILGGFPRGDTKMILVFLSR